MKFFLFVSCFLPFVFSSCKKNNDISPTNTVSVTINGVNRTFNMGVAARTVTTSGSGSITNLNITGADKLDGTGNTISISLASANGNAITTGTYTIDPLNITPAVLPTVSCSIVQGLDRLPLNTDLAGNYITTITITSISSTNVQGKFSGTLVSPYYVHLYPIVDGVFNAKIN